MGAFASSWGRLRRAPTGHRAAAMAERVVSRFFRPQAPQTPPGIHGRPSEQPRQLLGPHLVEESRGLLPTAEQPGVEEVGGTGSQMRHEAPVRGPGGRGSAATPVLDPEIRREPDAQFARPVP